jgi:hypothetical protein
LKRHFRGSGLCAKCSFLGIFGVIQALESAGALGSFQRPVIPLLIMAVLATMMFFATHALFVSRHTTLPQLRAR